MLYRVTTRWEANASPEWLAQLRAQLRQFAPTVERRDDELQVAVTVEAFDALNAVRRVDVTIAAQLGDPPALSVWAEPA